MPVTPFHGGVGLLAKACFGSRYSLISFCATQVVIDCESGYHLLRGDWPVHRGLHTVAGATVACALVAATAGLVGARLRRRASAAAPIAPTLAGLVRADLAAAASLPAAILTVVTGVLGHLVPDAIMHFDVLPLAPLADANPLYELVSVATLHALLILCAIGGTLGIVRRLRTPRA